VLADPSEASALGPGLLKNWAGVNVPACIESREQAGKLGKERFQPATKYLVVLVAPSVARDTGFVGDVGWSHVSMVVNGDEHD
jgi:hypothetical protein